MNWHKVAQTILESSRNEVNDDEFMKLVPELKAVRVITSRILLGIGKALVAGLANESDTNQPSTPTVDESRGVVALLRPGLLRNKRSPDEDPPAA